VLTRLAGETGGEFVHSTNDLAAAAGAALNSMGKLYFLGFLSKQPLDGRFHQIRVSTTAPRVRLYTRKGYFATLQNPAAATAESEGEAEDTESLLSRAAEARAAGDMPALIDSLERLARRFPNEAAIWYNIGVASLKTEEHGRAVEALQKAFILSPDDMDIGTALARAFTAGGAHDAAAETLITMIQRHPGNLALMFQLGRTLEASTRSREAYQVYRQMLDYRLGLPAELYLALTRTSLTLGRGIEADLFMRDYLSRGGPEEAIEPYRKRRALP